MSKDRVGSGWWSVRGSVILVRLRCGVRAVSKMLPALWLPGEVLNNRPLTFPTTLGSEEPLKGVWIIPGLPVLQAQAFPLK